MPEYLPGQQLTAVQQSAVRKTGANARVDRSRYDNTRVYRGKDGKTYVETTDKQLVAITGTATSNTTGSSSQTANTALDAAAAAQNTANAHAARTDNPHQVTAEQAGAIPVTAIGAANGVAGLDGNGFLTSAEMPPVTITDTFPVNSEVEMLALICERGDVAVRLDQNSQAYILRVEPSSTLANWQQIGMAPDMPIVISVNGQTGIVVIDDVDTVDGKHATDFAPAGYGLGQTSPWIDVDLNTVVKTGFYYAGSNSTNKPGAENGWLLVEAYSNLYAKQIYCTPTGAYYLRTLNNGTWGAWKTIWHAGNDGAGSGLDADTVDGLESTDFAPAIPITPKPATDLPATYPTGFSAFGPSGDSSWPVTYATVLTYRFGGRTVQFCYEMTTSNMFVRSLNPGDTTLWTPWARIAVWGSIPQFANAEIGSRTTAGMSYLSFHSSGNNQAYDARIQATDGSTTIGTGMLNLMGGTVQINGNTAWHAGNDGSGSGLDADTVDGKQASELITRQSDGRALVYSAVDLNTMITTGIYWITSTGSTNLPEAVSGSLLVTQLSSVYVTQLFETYAGKLFVRGMNNGTWTSWVNAREAMTKSVDDIDLNNVKATGFYYASTNVTTNKPVSHNGWLLVEGLDTNYVKQTYCSYTNEYFLRTCNYGTWSSWQKIWHTGNDGSGSGLDADTCDGQHLGATAAPTFSGATFDNNQAYVKLYAHYDSANSAPTIVGAFSRGTQASPSIAQSQDALFSFGARGYTGSDYSPYNSAQITAIAEENFTATGLGTSWNIYTTPIGSTSRQLRVKVAADGTLQALAGLKVTGNVGFFGTTPVAQQAALTAANTSIVDVNYGLAEADVINNLRTRVNELEARLNAYGLLP